MHTCFWLIGILTAWAAATQAGVRLNLTEVLALTEKHNPELAATRAQIEGAAADLVTARAYPNPEIEMGGGQSLARVPNLPSGFYGNAGVAQPLDLPFVRGPRRRSGELGVEAAAAGYGHIRRSILTRAKQAFYAVLRQQELLKIADENRRLLETTRGKIQTKVEVGEGARYELVKAEAELLTATKNRETAALRVEQSKAGLRSLIGPALPLDFDLSGALPSRNREELKLDDLREDVLAAYPSLLQAIAEIERAGAQLELEKALRYPQPTLRASAQQEPELHQWRVDLVLPIPLWNQRQGPIARAEADRERALAQAEQLRLQLLYELENTLAAYRIATRQLETFEGGLLKEAEAALRVAEAAFRLGERGILDYLDAQRTYQAVRIDYINALFDQNDALLQIQRLRRPVAEDPLS